MPEQEFAISVMPGDIVRFSVNIKIEDATPAPSRPKPAPALPGEWRDYPDRSGWWAAYDANEDYNPYRPIYVTLGGDGVVTNLHTGRRILRVNNIPPRWLRLPDAPPNA